MKPRSVTHASFTIERHFRQAPARVFAAFATEKGKQAWFHGPDEWARDVHKLDFRVGGIETREMLRTFNCGVGMLAAVAPGDVERFIADLSAEGENAVVIGELVERQGEPVTFDGSLKL